MDEGLTTQGQGDRPQADRERGTSPGRVVKGRDGELVLFEGEPIIEAPMWVISHLVTLREYGFGVRLPKMPVWKPGNHWIALPCQQAKPYQSPLALRMAERRATNVVPFRPVGPLGYRPSSDTCPLSKQRAPGNLHKSLYRFYIGSPVRDSNFCLCRCCRRPFYSEIERELHKDTYETSCTVMLVQAYKYFLKLGKCMCCEQQTTKTMWGVPICSEKCVDEWMYSAKPSMKLMACLVDAGAMKRKAKPVVYYGPDDEDITGAVD